MEVSWKFLRWTLAGRCASIFGWKLEMDHGWGIVRGDWLESFEWNPAGKSGLSFGRKFWMAP